MLGSEVGPPAGEADAPPEGEDEVGDLEMPAESAPEPLAEMETNNSTNILCIGPPISGKTTQVGRNACTVDVPVPSSNPSHL